MWENEVIYSPINNVVQEIRRRMLYGKISSAQAQKQIEELKKLEPELQAEWFKLKNKKIIIMKKTN